MEVVPAVEDQAGGQVGQLEATHAVTLDIVYDSRIFYPVQKSAKKIKFYIFGKKRAGSGDMSRLQVVS